MSKATNSELETVLKTVYQKLKDLDDNDESRSYLAARLVVDKMNGQPFSPIFDTELTLIEQALGIPGTRKIVVPKVESTTSDLSPSPSDRLFDL